MYAPSLEVNQREHLESSYRATSYVALFPRKDVLIRLGRLNQELDECLRGLNQHRWIFITAWNPGSVLTDPEQNQKQQQRLMADLNQLQLGYVKGYGQGDKGDWPEEESLLVLGLAREEGRCLGRQYKQMAVLYGELGGYPELLWCR